MSGPPLDLNQLRLPELGPVRQAVMAAAAGVAALPDPAGALGLAPSTTEDLRQATHLTSAPTAPAHRLYSGVLYEAAGFTGSEAQTDAVMIFSGMFGVVGLGDALPAYRLPASVKLDFLPDGELLGQAGAAGTAGGPTFAGKLNAFWRRHLAGVVQEYLSAAQLIIDCRSAAYEAMWKTPSDLSKITYRVAVMREKDGKRSVVSHNAKYARGLLAGALARAGQPPAEIGEVAAVARTLCPASGGHFLTEVAPPVAGARAIKPGTLTLIEVVE